MDLLDKLFGAVESGMDEVEKFADAGEGAWDVEEVYDSDDGSCAYLVKSSSGRKLETSDKALAERVSRLLNAAKKEEK